MLGCTASADVGLLHVLQYDAESYKSMLGCTASAVVDFLHVFAM